MLNQITPLLRELLTLSPQGKTAIELYLNESIKNGALPEDILTLEFKYLRQQLLTKLMRLLKSDNTQFERVLLYLHFGMRLDFQTLEQVLELSHGEFMELLFHSLEKLGLDPKLFSYRAPHGPNANYLTAPAWWPLVTAHENEDQSPELVRQILLKLNMKGPKAAEVVALRNFLQEKYLKKLTWTEKLHRVLWPDEVR
ncbi:MAG: hypothetical protein A2X86_16590 [Bdellovibrionales bacterium GWA2_49_15]|nr:MAG: hypothetical protein A2X86_16590 [Bdellovibrionales bacterium GWA2_49_15]HAZ13724.1 hypothetical protein [Bdellovibrionales bacterium]